MAWNFLQEAKTGAETALDACDYFIDEVLEVWKSSGGQIQMDGSKDEKSIMPMLAIDLSIFL